MTALNIEEQLFIKQNNKINETMGCYDGNLAIERPGLYRDIMNAKTSFELAKALHALKIFLRTRR